MPSHIVNSQKILYRDEMGTEIVGAGAEFVRALLQARPDKLKEIGSRRILRFKRMVHIRNTPCFFAELDDGKMLDISFMKAITNLATAQACVAE